jgi:hypothetical protein
MVEEKIHQEEEGKRRSWNEVEIGWVIFRLLMYNISPFKLKDIDTLVLVLIFSFLWLYSPILGPGRLHETFRFISVTRCRTVSRTPWMGDQLIARHLLTAPGECDDSGEVGGMNGCARGNWSTRRKPARHHFVHHKSHLPDSGASSGRRGRKPATNRFSYGTAILVLIVHLYFKDFRIVFWYVVNVIHVISWQEVACIVDIASIHRMGGH